LFYPPAGYAVTQENAGSDPALNSAVDPTTNTTVTTALDWGMVYSYGDMGLKVSSTGSVGNYVWFDRNGNGIQDEATNDGINGITVNAYATGNTSTPVASTVTTNDVNGNPGYYRLDGLAAGSYFLTFSKPTGATFTTLNATGSTSQTDSNVNPSTGKTVSFNLVAGQYDATWDAGIILPSGTASLGDRVWLDANNNGVYEPFGGELGIDGVRVNLYRDTDSNGAFTPNVDQYYTTSTTFTSGGYSGFYSFTGLPAGTYVVQIDPVNFLTGKPLAGLLTSSSLTDPANGIDNDNNGYLLSGFGAVSKAVTLDTQANMTLDFGFTATYSLGNRVFRDDGTGNGVSNDGIQNGAEPGIANVAVSVFKADASGNPAGTVLASQVTDADGYYRFDSLTAGNYVVVVDKIASKALNGLSSSTGYSTDYSLAGDQYDHGKDTPLAAGTVLVGGIASAPVSIGVGLQPTGEALGISSAGSNGPNGDANNNLTADFGFTPVYSLGDYVWFDTNQDGIQQPDERGIAGVTVNLYANDGVSLMRTTQTDGSGFYLFNNLATGNYVVGFAKPVGYQFSQQNQGSGALSDSFDSDADGNTGKTALVSLAGVNNPTVDAGLFLTNGAAPARIGDYVWYDTNRDGLQTQGEVGIAGVTVKLWDGGHTNVLAVTVTDGNGFYQFAGLPAASYVVEFTSQSGYTRSLYKSGSNGATDSDAAVDTGLTLPVTLTAGQTMTDLDSGQYLSAVNAGVNAASIGDKVWYDTDGNGIQDTGESGIPGVAVNLYDASGTILMAQTKTDGKGAYTFGGLLGASYIVEFAKPNGSFAFSPQSQGSNGALDSDVDTTSGRASVSVAASQNRTDIDAGMAITGVQPITIGDSVWLDGNGDLAFNTGEGQANVRVVLYDGLGNELARLATSASDANYLFTGLAQGNYRVAVDKSSLPTNAALIADPDALLDSMHDVVNQTAGTNAMDFGYSTHIDFGDLPNSYGTSLTSNGARHAITGIYLGNSATDAESDGQVTNDATGDNVNGSTPNDENGVSFAGPWIKGQNANLKVVASAVGVLNAWADWNHSGSFDDGEQVLTNQALATGLNNLAVAVPANAVAGQMAVRFRATDANGQGGSSPTGIAVSGEAEDYFTTVYVAGNVGSIAGQVRNDTNGDGNLSAAYGGLAGAVVTLYTDPNGDGNPADGTTIDTYTTLVDGNYSFTAPVLGNYVVVETNPTGYTSTNDALPPNDDSIAVAMPSFSAVKGRDFLDSLTPHLGSITGQVRNDTRGDGNLSATYAGLAGATLTLYTDPNGDGDPSDGLVYASQTTDTSGSYRFAILPLGNYVVVQTGRPVAVPPFFPTNDAVAPNDDQIPIVLTVASANASGADFLDCQHPLIAPPPLGFVAIDSRLLTDQVGVQGQGLINLFKDASATDLEAYRDDNGGELSFGFKISETKKGTETALSEGVSLKDAVLTLIFSDGRQKTYSITNGSCYTETYSLLTEVGDPTRKLRYTLLGSEDTNRAGAINAIQNTFDSTLKCYVPDALDGSTNAIKLVSATLNVQFLQTDTSKGDPEAFYDFSGNGEQMALLNAADRRFIDQYQSGGLKAPAKALTNPTPIPDPLAVTSWNHFPSGNTFYFVAYEDMYPNLGDYDFNDAVVAYQVQYGLNSDNQVVKIVGNAYLLAKGAAYSHDWHLRIGLPGTVKTAVECTTSLPTTPQTNIACSGTNPILSTGIADVLVFADTGKIFPNTQFTDYRKVFTNTLFGSNFLKGPKSTFSISLNQPIDPAKIGVAPFDPYLYVRDTKQTIQLLQVNAAIKDANGYPYGMLMPSGWSWPYEKTDIRTAYSKFSSFTASQGTSSVDWYNFAAKYQTFPAPKTTGWAW
jgi:LruC domain-containing protein